MFRYIIKTGFYCFLALVVTALGWRILHLHQNVRPDYPLVFDNATHEFGVVGWEKHLRHTFHFTNVSKQNVAIRSLEPSCGCTVAHFSSDLLHPNESASVTVDFDPYGYSGLTEKQIEFNLVDFRQALSVQIRAHVKPPVQLAGGKIDYGNVRLGDQSTVRASLWNGTGGTLNILSITAPDYIRVRTASPLLRRGQETQVSFTLLHPPAGMLDEMIRITTDYSPLPDLTIPVHAQVQCPWDLPESKCFLGFVNIGEYVQRDLLVKGLPPAEVDRVWTNMPASTVQYAPLSAEQGIRLHFAADTVRQKAREIDNSIFVQTKGHSTLLLRIPLVGVLQDPQTSSCCKK